MDKKRTQCEWCIYHVYDDRYNSLVCQMTMDEDELARLAFSKRYQCPYFRFGDDYTIVKKQI